MPQDWRDRNDYAEEPEDDGSWFCGQCENQVYALWRCEYCGRPKLSLSSAIDELHEEWRKFGDITMTDQTVSEMKARLNIRNEAIKSTRELKKMSSRKVRNKKDKGQ